MSSRIAFLLKFAVLARKRLRSKAEYFRFQSHQANGIFDDIREILQIRPGDFAVDYGCGSGGYTRRLADFFDSVLGVDFHTDPFQEMPNVEFLSGDLQTVQLNSKADFVFCSSVFEHIARTEDFVRNLAGNMNRGAKLYLSFPPFYSVGGGHQLKPFHYLPEKSAIAIGKRLGKIKPTATGYADMFGDWGLYKMSIKGAKQVLVENGFEILVVKPRYVPSNLPFNTARYPLLAELLTWHVEFYARRGSPV